MSPRPASPLPRLAAALAFLLLPGLAMTASAQSSPPAERGTLLSVTAEAHASRVPDVAALSAGAVAASQAIPVRARKPWPGGEVSSIGSGPQSP